ncbi:MAG TPA: HAMP domain-containing sensor histidine kinase [Chthoniobacterales bacterium]
MKSAATRPPEVRRFRVRLLVAMMLVVAALTSLGIYVTHQRAAEDARTGLQRDFELELEALHRLQELRNSAVADRSRELAQNARIHAALEDNALDLLYPSAQEELRDLLNRPDPDRGSPANALHARFYRFLDSHGAVIVPRRGEAGTLSPNEQAKLAQNHVPQTMQTGYLLRNDGDAVPEGVDEMIAVPIRSTETNEVIAALVLGFKPVETSGRNAQTGMLNGILVDGVLRMPGVDRTDTRDVAHEVERSLSHTTAEDRSSLRTTVKSLPHLLFFKQLNLKSNYPPAYEVCLYPLSELLARQSHLRMQILAIGGLLLSVGFVVSHFLSRRLSQPVEELAVVSEENLAQRRRAEARLESTEEELQRSARFSADASHQLKSPITVLRAGLDSLLARDGFPKEVYEEVSSLIHQTYRLTGVVEDLLLLSRMDAGKLRLTLQPIDLARLVEEWRDDLQALPEAASLRIETEIPPELLIAGEAGFTALIVQNLLDNARKYNHPGGTIRINATSDDGRVKLSVANTGRGIPPAAQPFVFERFHRAGVSSDVPGHGLGLNLAHELTRLHGGELRLVSSDARWTKFAVIFLAASARDGISRSTG